MLLRLVGWIFTWLLLIVLGGLCVVFWLFYHYGQGLPDYEKLAKYEPPVLSRLYASDGRLFREYAEEKRLFVPINAIPSHVVQAFLVAEDKNFYDHFGLDLLGIIRAAFTNLSNKGQKRPVGASTITQQVAKNFLLASNEVSLSRKIKEAILSLRIEKTFSKPKILELYLNEIYLGRGSYGVASAALRYFNKSLENLNTQEVAFLAGLPKAPSRYDPVRSPELAKSRRDWVLGRMVEEGTITAEQGERLKAEPILLRKRNPEQVVVADYFAEGVRRELVQRYGERSLYKEGLVVRTSLDPSLQKIAEKSLKTGLISYDRRHGWRGPVHQLSPAQMQHWHQSFGKISLPAGASPWVLGLVLHVSATHAEIALQNGDYGRIPLEKVTWARKALKDGGVGAEIRKVSQVLTKGDVVLVSRDEETPTQQDLYCLEQLPEANGSVVVLDPHSGRVLALVGGYSFEASQFDRATQAMRQTGSAFKPLVFLAALEKGMTPSSRVDDAPISIPLGKGLGYYQPKNISKQYYGPTTLRVALEKSRNVATVRLAAEHVGIERIIELAERLGVSENMPRQFAMALGAGETTLLKLTSAYGVIANGGKKITPSLIDLIHNRHGRILFNGEQRTCKGCRDPLALQPLPPTLMDKREQIVDPVSAYQLLSILEGVIQRGTGRLLKQLERPLAGKTGSTNNFRDALFIGVSPEWVVGISIGHDDFRSLGPKEPGSRVAAPVFLEFGKAAFADMPVTPFKIPPGVRLVRVHPVTGQPASGNEEAIFEAFRKDYEDEPLEEGEEIILKDGTEEEEEDLPEITDLISQEDEAAAPETEEDAPLTESEPEVSEPLEIPQSSEMPVDSSPEEDSMLEGTGGIY